MQDEALERDDLGQKPANALLVNLINIARATGFTQNDKLLGCHLELIH